VFPFVIRSNAGLFTRRSLWEGDFSLLAFSNHDVTLGDYFYVRVNNDGIDVKFGAPPSLTPAGSSL
jgi:hypothetical protein